MCKSEGEALPPKFRGEVKQQCKWKQPPRLWMKAIGLILDVLFMAGYDWTNWWMMELHHRNRRSIESAQPGFFWNLDTLQQLHDSCDPKISPQEKTTKKDTITMGRYTPLKFNIAPKNRQSQRKLIFQPSFFRGYVKFRGCIYPGELIYWPLESLENCVPFKLCGILGLHLRVCIYVN